MLDITSLENAITQLETYYSYSTDQNLWTIKEEMFPALRASAIQAYEFTFELTYKIIRRYLVLQRHDSEEVERWSYSEVIREAYSVGIIKGELEAWKDYRKFRATTSHAYDNTKAQDVYDQIPSFLSEAKFVAKALASRRLD